MDAEHKKQIDELKKKSKADVENAVAEYKNQLAGIDKEKAEALKRAETLEKQLAVTSSAETVKFKVYFDAIQNDSIKISEALKTLKSKDADSATKFKDAFLKYLEAVKQNIQEV